MPRQFAGFSPLSALFAFALCITPPVNPQTEPQTQSQRPPYKTTPIPPDNPVLRLIAEAKAADTKGEVQPYAWHLAGALLAGRTNRGYANLFAQRLTKADLLARQGKQKWIPESVVAQSFNSLMDQIDQTGKPPQVDVGTVHQLRIIFSGFSPALTTVKSHESECLPTEAVDLLNQLIVRNGSLEFQCPPKPGPNGQLVQSPCNEQNSASMLLFEYSKPHSQTQMTAFFDQIAQLFGL